MADQKISQLTSLTTPASADLLVIIDDANGTPTSKRITLKNLFGGVPSNTAISGTTTLTGNTTLNHSNTVISSNVNFTGSKGPKINSGYVTLANATTVSSNNTTTVLGSGGLQGSFFWDENYLYVAVSNTEIKRVAISAFTP